MNRRAFFNFLPGAAVATAAGVAKSVRGPVRAEEIDGLEVKSGGHLTISNVIIHASPGNVGITVKQAT